MTQEELFFANETRKHQQLVAKYLMQIARELMKRAAVHDVSKMEAPEREAFIEATPKLRALTYGSSEYNTALAEMQGALRHHYDVNSHHPEHYTGGIVGMSLIDIVEMLMDWLAATERHDDGDIMKSIELNQARFEIEPQLKSILCNTIIRLGGADS